MSFGGTNRVGEDLQVSQYDLVLYRSLLGIKYRLKSQKYFVGYIMQGIVLISHISERRSKLPIAYESNFPRVFQSILAYK